MRVVGELLGELAAEAGLRDPSIVVQEAGGRFTGLDGTEGPAAGSGLASNGLLHEELDLGYGMRLSHW